VGQCNKIGGITFGAVLVSCASPPAGSAALLACYPKVAQHCCPAAECSTASVMGIGPSQRIVAMEFFTEEWCFGFAAAELDHVLKRKS